MRLILASGLTGLALLVACDDSSVGTTPCLDAPCPRLTDAPYVRTGEPDGAERFWTQAARNCVTVHPGGADPLSDAALEGALRGAARAWSDAAIGCQAAMCVRVEERVSDALGYTHDDRNVVGIVGDEGAWAALPEASDTALAITISHVDARTGEILGADVAVNLAHHAFSQRPEGPRARENDLQSVLLHELGHLIGFDHPATGTDSIMIKNLNLGEARRSLTAVDVAGVCETFARPSRAAFERSGEAPSNPLPTPAD